MTAYYNEFDPFAAQWLRELIKQGHIAPGEVDERSIEDVSPHDLDGFTQCHFFAGIGVWSYALRRAGWPDDKPVWTGSCPCQPFSTAGKGGGFDDERHLWPSWYWLIEQCRPAVLFGEQVASKAVEPWIDLVQTDLEALGYAFGCIPFPSAGVGAPHIRDRAYWVANPNRSGLQSRSKGCTSTRHRQAAEPDSRPSRMAHANDAGSQGRPGVQKCPDQRSARTNGVAGGLADAERIRREVALLDHRGGGAENPLGKTGFTGMREPVGWTTTRPTNGHWRDADWLLCRDGKWRPVEPGTFPLAHGAAARVGRLRGYGNAINAPAAQEFIEAYLEAEMLI